MSIYSDSPPGEWVTVTQLWQHGTQIVQTLRTAVLGIVELVNCSEMALETRSWSSLPDHIVVSILSYLTPCDRGRAGTTCKAWHNCSKSPYLWQRFAFNFMDEQDGRTVACLDQYAKYIRTVSISANQHETENRVNACKVLSKLSHVEGRRLTSLRIRFTGENPLFYAGYEFVDELKLLFGKPLNSGTVPCQLKYVDLSGLSVAYDDSVFYLLSENNPQLETLNILNQILVCKVTPECIQRVVEKCKNLTDLRLFHCSMSDDVLRAFAQPDRSPPKHIGILCRREQKYTQDLTSEAWTELVKQCPNVRVALGFDHTCPLRKVAFVMKSEVPVVELRLETYTYLYDEVNQAASFYRNTLEKVVLQTRNSPELANSLINLCSRCTKLTTLLVYCVLEKEIVDKILELCPVMKERGSYNLKWKREPEQVVVGVEDGD